MSLQSSLLAKGTLDPDRMVDPGRADSRFLKTPDGERLSVPDFSDVAFDRQCPDGVNQLLNAFAAGEKDPVNVVEAFLEAMNENQTGREAVLRLAPGFAEAAEASAKAWKTGVARPLEGIPFAVKDIIDVAGTQITCGSHFTGERVAVSDAASVKRLRDAGAIPLAIAATSEFACGGPANPRYGTVTNPWERSRWTGGSSTGSAAILADRLLPLALGTDTGGSIRVPSCWCGTTGLKPSREAVSRSGVAPLSWTLDHVGPMARSAADIARVLPFMVEKSDAALDQECQEILAGAGVAGLKIGVPKGWFVERVGADTLNAWNAVFDLLRDLGCTLVDMPEIDIGPWHEAGWVILQSELAAFHSERLHEADRMEPGMMRRLRNGMRFSALDYTSALQQRVEAQETILAAMQDADVFITPGIGGPAGSLATLTVDVDGKAYPFQEVISRNTMIFDFTGFPALMLPTGQTGDGLPVGAQIVGRPGSDGLCLRVGAAFQAATNFHLLQPPGHAPIAAEAV